VTNLARRVIELPLEQPARVAPDATLRDVARAMRAAGSSFAVVASHGLVTEHDLTSAIARGMEADAPARCAASSSSTRIGASSTLLEAAMLMLEREVSFLVVLNAAGLEEGILCLAATTVHLLDVVLPSHVWDWP
jgi:signal-transduction protein with cAMP-binding, CBS, and nucleotidyltransferase domain